MRRLLLFFVVAAALGGIAVASTFWQRGGQFVASISWQLQAVSEDGRSLTVVHEIPHCSTEPGRITVRESARQVEIRIPEVTVAHFGTGFICTADQRFGPSTVRLATPLGRRKLVQPTRNGNATKTNGILDAADPLRPECDQLARLPAGAPALDVPWVARRQRFCAAPLPAAMLRVPLLRRAPSALDRLPTRSQTTTYTEDQALLQTSSARRLLPGKQLWLVPGAHRSCFLRIFPATSYQGPEPFYSPCRPSARIGRDGAVIPERCVRRRTPKTIALVGMVPAGIDHVRLRPDRGAARSVAVRGGVWAARVAYPAEIAYGPVRVRTTYEFRACYS